MEKRKDKKGRVLRKGESQRKDGGYLYRYTDIHGKRKYIYDNDLNNLRKKENDVRTDIQDNIDYRAAQQTFNDYFLKYLKIKEGIKSSTRKTYVRNWEMYIKETVFGNMKLQDIKKTDVILLLNSMSEKGLSKTSIQTILAGVLSPCLSMAVEDDIIRINPSSRCGKYISGESPVAKITLTVDEQNRFLQYVKNSKYAIYYPLFVFMLETAVRIGEAAGLTWKDVDLSSGFVHITHQLQYSKESNSYAPHIVSPKSKSSTRIIPLSAAARNALVEQRKIQFEMGRRTKIEIDGYKDFVFSNRDSRPIITQTISRYLSRIVEDYNNDIRRLCFDDNMKLPKIHPHLLRHTACTRMAEAGIDPRTLQSILGHSSIKITMDIYNHVTEERLTNEIKKMNVEIPALKLVR